MSNPAAAVDTTHALYRFRDDAGALLYVGITNNPGRRWAQHQRAKPWWHQVHRVDVEHHPDRAAVLRAEALAIRTERPRHNIAGSVEAEHAPRGCRIQCAECTETAIGVYVLSAELRAYKKWRNNLPQVLTDDDFESIPHRARWRGCCSTHMPDDDAVAYWFDGVTSRRAAVDVLRHLGEKEWVGELTGWDELAVRLLAPYEAALPRGRAL